MFHHLFWPAFFEYSICRKLQAQLRPSCFWIVEQDAVVECSKHCFEVADRTCEASILSLCSLFKLQRCALCFFYLQPSTVSQTVEAVRRWDNEIEF